MHSNKAGSSNNSRHVDWWGDQSIPRSHPLQKILKKYITNKWHKQWGDEAFFCCRAQTLEQASPDIHTATNKGLFKPKLKTHFSCIAVTFYSRLLHIFNVTLLYIVFLLSYFLDLIVKHFGLLWVDGKGLHKQILTDWALTFNVPNCMVPGLRLQFVTLNSIYLF